MDARTALAGQASAGGETAGHRRARFGQRAGRSVTSGRELLSAAQHGDAAAFERLFDEHHAAIASYCTRVLGNATDGEDAAQLTFICAFRDLKHQPSDLHVRGWLFRVAHNRCISMLRGRTTHVELDAAEARSAGRLVGDAVEERERFRELVNDLAGLPDAQRRALTLSQLGDETGHEIAQDLGCSPGKVRALIYQARDSLQATRDAREADCQHIQSMIRRRRGRPPRIVSRHLNLCPACKAFRDAAPRLAA
ncbi:hypothetical protein AYO39_02420 [Actinobacteria bacterium SCGC AG-212-D09]|nr:hypothetical protein AYO39_02420 [Actinobacteria bacterium SCGC AG-212-D09]